MPANNREIFRCVQMYDDAKIAVVMTVDIAWNNLPAGKYPWIFVVGVLVVFCLFLASGGDERSCNAYRRSDKWFLCMVGKF